MNIFEYEDYRLYLKENLADEESRTPGARKRLVQATGISSSLLTQIFSELKQLSTEQAVEVASHWSLTDVETDYFMFLVEYGKAGSEKLRNRLRQKIRKLRLASQKVNAKVAVSVSLSEEQKAIYYSHWLYTGVRNLVPTKNGQGINEISQKLGVPVDKVETVVNYLIEIGLLKKINNQLQYQAGYSHLDSGHPLIFRHHQNWRQRAIHRMDQYTEDHLHYTCPMGISKKAAREIRQNLVEEIKRLNKGLTDEPEVSFCLNIDFFEY